MKIQESGENYLETILILKNRNGYVRSVDVANEALLYQSERQPCHEYSSQGGADCHGKEWEHCPDGERFCESQRRL